MRLFRLCLQRLVNDAAPLTIDEQGTAGQALDYGAFWFCII